MAGEYTVKILSSEEFNKLPFKRIQENAGDVYGAADTRTKTAYVRDTGYNDFTKATISHELDELMSGISPHEEEGIRYKSLGDMFGSIGGGIKSGVGAVGSGIGALGRGIKNVFTPGPAAPMATGPGGRMITGTPQAGTPAALPALMNNPSTGSPFTGGAGTAASFARAAGSSPSIASGATGSASGGGIGGFLSDMFSGTGTAFKQGMTGQGPSAPPTGGTSLPASNVPSTQVQPNFMEQLFNSLGKNAPGAAVAGLGDLLSPKREDLDVSGITNSLRDRVSGDRPPTELFGAAEAELLGNLGSTPGAPPDSVFARGDQVIEEDLQDQLKQLEDQFKRATGNANVNNNSAYLAEKSRLEERARERRSAVRDEISFQFTREQLTRDLQEVEMALNLDSKQTEQMIRIAQLDAEALAVNYNLELREAQEFKDLFAKFGDLLFRQTPEDQATPGAATNAAIG